MAVTYASNVFSVSLNTSTSGTGTITCAGTTVKLGAGTFGATAVTGTGTAFTTQLRPGSLILVGTDRLLVYSISSDTALIAFKKDNATNVLTLATATAFTFHAPTLWSDMLTAVAAQAATIAQGNVTSINFVTATVTIDQYAVFMLDDFSTMTFGNAGGYRMNNYDGFLVFRNGGAMTYTGNVQYGFFAGFLNVWSGELSYVGNSPGGTVRQDFFSPDTKSNGMSALAVIYAGGTASANTWYTHLEPLAGKFGALRFSNETRAVTTGAGAGINVQFGSGTYANVSLPSAQSTYGFTQNVYVYLARSGGETVLTTPVLSGSSLIITGDTAGTARLVDEEWKDLAAGTVGTIVRDTTYPGSTTVTRQFTYFPGTLFQSGNPVFLRIANSSGTTAINGAVSSAAGVLMSWQTFASNTNVTTNFSPFSLTARRKDIEEITASFTPTAPITYNNPLATDVYFTTDASAQTGITINGTTKIIDVGVAVTLDRLYDYSKYSLSQNLDTPNFLSPSGKELELLSTWTATQVNNLTAATKLTSLKASTAFTASGAMASIGFTGSVGQATPTNLTGVTVTGTLTYNTNSATSITYTTCTIGTVANTGTGLVTITPTGSTVTTYTDAEINYLDSSITATGITLATIYPSEADRDANTNAGPTFSSILNFKLGSTVSGVVMTGTVYLRVNVSGVTLLVQLTLALGANVLDLGVQGQLSTISGSLATKPTLAQIEASTVLAKEATVAVKASQTSVNAIPTTPLLAANYTAPDNTSITAIKAKTDTLVNAPTLAQIEGSTVLAKESTLSTKASQASVTALGTPMQAGEVVDANIIKVNDVLIDGAGTQADPFGPV